MDMQTFLIVANIAIVTWLLPVIFLGLNRQHPVFTWLMVCLLFSFITEITAKFLFSLKINPNYAVNTYPIFAVIGFTYFFYHAIGWKSLKFPVIIFNLIYFAFACWNFFELQKLSPNSYTVSVKNLFILFLSILFFYKILSELPLEKVQKNPLFVIISGFLISYAGKLVLSVVTHYFITQLKDNMILMAILYNLLTIIGNIIIAIGTYLHYREQKLNRIISR